MTVSFVILNGWTDMNCTCDRRANPTLLSRWDLNPRMHASRACVLDRLTTRQSICFVFPIVSFLLFSEQLVYILL